MSNVWKAVACLFLLAVGILVILRLRTNNSEAPATESATVQRPTPVDLIALYDTENSSFDAPGSWQAVPRGLQTSGNIPFQIGGLIQLWGQGPAGIGRNYREKVEGVPATGKFETLYILHGASFATMEETPIAEVVFQYADGSAATNGIRFGTNVRDWWQTRTERQPSASDQASKVIWRGKHPSLPGWVKSLRLFGTAMPNPKPGNEVKSVDLVSTKSQVTWVVLAMTTGPSGLLKVDPKLDLDQNEEVESDETDLDLKK